MIWRIRLTVEDQSEYASFLNEQISLRKGLFRVAVVGAGGIGFDVAEYLVAGHSATTDPALWRREWGRWQRLDGVVARGELEA